MEPTLFNGDIVIYNPISINNNSSLKEGSLVIARHPIKINVLLIKRIYLISNNGVDLRGDNYKESKDSRHFGLVNLKNIIGIVDKRISNQTSNNKRELIQKIIPEVR